MHPVARQHTAPAIPLIGLIWDCTVGNSRHQVNHSLPVTNTVQCMNAESGAEVTTSKRSIVPFYVVLSVHTTLSPHNVQEHACTWHLAPHLSQQLTRPVPTPAALQASWHCCCCSSSLTSSSTGSSSSSSSSTCCYTSSTTSSSRSSGIIICHCCLNMPHQFCLSFCLPIALRRIEEIVIIER
jgi:hypothetical protein